MGARTKGAARSQVPGVRLKEVELSTVSSLGSRTTRSHVVPPLVQRPRARSRVMLVGCGPHSARTHLPFLSNCKEVELVACVEVAGQVPATESALESFSQVTVMPVEPWTTPLMPGGTADMLSRVVQTERIDAVIIATEPLAHLAYLVWGMSTGCHLFVDKPIVMLPGVANDAAIARELDSVMRRLVTQAARTPDRLVAVGTQRRYHAGLELAKSLVVDAAARFETPITSMESSHADGQFRYPNELDFAYHGFVDGYGKLGHSGFHMIATQADLVAATAEAAGVTFDSFTTYASTVRPAGFLKQVPRTTYERHFGRDVWTEESPVLHADIAERVSGYGEVDVDVINTFYSEGDAMLLSSINLAHTSVSRRSALKSNADLYKGNGRIKHEYHSFKVGPFIAVQVHSYQSRSKHDVLTGDERRAGGNDSMAVHVYRNADWYPTCMPELEVFTGDDIAHLAGMPAGKTFTGHAKELMLGDFFAVVRGEKPVDLHRCPLDSHLLGGSMLSAAFESVASGSPVARELGRTEVAR